MSSTAKIVSSAAKTRAVEILNNWQAMVKRGDPNAYELGLEAMMNFYELTGMPTFTPILPMVLSLKGKPFSLKDHFVFEPMYRRFGIPHWQLWRTGRQVAKSTNLAAQGVLYSGIQPYFNTIYVTPLFEQIRRFSSNYVRPFIQDSPMRIALIGEKVEGAQNVLQRTFRNGSIMFFTFCFMDAERVRGISADRLCLDEVQDINWDHLPVLEHCLSASPFRIVSMTGTSKTRDNTIERLWVQSSMAEWVIPCGCGYSNVCSIELDLDLMIQKKGLCCRKCGNLVNSRSGRFVHQTTDRERIRDYPGYHVPQVVLPLHYDNPDNWAKIMRVKNGQSQARYFNECLGEACDIATRLVSLTDLERASARATHNNEEDEALEYMRQQRFDHVVMGLDWGGGAGGTVRRIRGIITIEGGSPSFTLATIVGFRNNSLNPHVIYTERFPSSWGFEGDVKRVLQLYGRFRCYRLGHDFAGGGNLREMTLKQAGFPTDLIMPFVYLPISNGPVVEWQPPVGPADRNYYKLDKTRSLSMICQMIKRNACSFPTWNSVRDIAEDFLSLIEDKRDRPGRSDMTLIIRDPSKSDDFCHSLNFGCMAHWHTIQQYPDMAELYNASISRQEVDALYPNTQEITDGFQFSV